MPTRARRKMTNMVTNRSVPVDTVLPHVIYQSVPDAVAWLSKTCGFTEHYRYGEPTSGAQVFLGKAYIMLKSAPSRATPAQLGYGTQSLTIFVPDVDAHYARTKAAGANIFAGYATRRSTANGSTSVEDLEGHRWLFSQHARDVKPR